MSELEEPTPTGISRRTVTKAMAWAVPAIAIAAPVPAFAGASQGTITLIQDRACKLPGNSSFPYNVNGAVYLLTITNTTASSSTVTITGITRTGSTATGIAGASLVKISGAAPCCTQLGPTVTAPANSVEVYALVTGGWDNSSNGTLTVSYNVNGVAQTPATTTPNSLNPITPGGNNCEIGGSCSIPSDDVKKCISAAVGVVGCTGTCVPAS